MKKDLLRGKMVHLTMEDPEILAKIHSQWNSDTEYARLLDWGPANCFSAKAAQKWFEKDGDNENNHYFTIRTLKGDKAIGLVGLDGIRWNHRDCYVGIGLGERKCWGKGYGTDAMNIILRYAFTELNLHRVTLGVFEYNPRAIRSYEKAGFVHEGRERSMLFREGTHWDLITMGILREEWIQKQEESE